MALIKIEITIYGSGGVVDPVHREAFLKEYGKDVAIHKELFSRVCKKILEIMVAFNNNLKPAVSAEAPDGLNINSSDEQKG